MTWDGAVGYGVNYSLEGENEARITLLKTADGIDYQWVADLDVPDFPNETTVRILPDKKMLMMVRREKVIVTDIGVLACLLIKNGAGKNGDAFGRTGFYLSRERSFSSRFTFLLCPVAS